MILQMAWRNIWRNKIRSVVIMLSVSTGLLAGIGVLALYEGMLESRVRTVIDVEVGHLQIHHPEFKKDYHPSFVLSADASVLNQVLSDPAVKSASGRTVVQGMLVSTTGSAGVQINGIDSITENAVSHLDQKVKSGRGLRPGKTNDIVIGKKLATKMRLNEGSKIVLTFTDTSDAIVSSAFRVVGIYESGNAPLDELNVYVPVHTLNELLLTGNGMHEIAVVLKDDEFLEPVQARMVRAFPSLLVESWKEISPETELMVRTVDEYSYIIMIIILIAVAFGILNTMLMSVLERTREIGMMVALGTSRWRIFLLVFCETIFLATAGTPVGLIVGYVLTGYFERNGLDLSGMGEEMMASFGYSTTVYPSFPWDKLGVILEMVVITAVVSCVLPAIKALQLRPVEALRR